jgi:hypothetical protein
MATIVDWLLTKGIPRRHIVRCPVALLNTTQVPSAAIFSIRYASI